MRYLILLNEWNKDVFCYQPTTILEEQCLILLLSLVSSKHLSSIVVSELEKVDFSEVTMLKTIEELLFIVGFIVNEKLHQEENGVCKKS